MRNIDWHALYEALWQAAEITGGIVSFVGSLLYILDRRRQSQSPVERAPISVSRLLTDTAMTFSDSITRREAVADSGVNSLRLA
jgi:hypothetical protein